MRYLIILLILIMISGCTVQEKQTNFNTPKEIMHENTPDILIKDKLPIPTEKKSETITLKELKNVEIKEYDGKKLDSAVDVRDLSIKGPQYVDVDNYKLEITGLVEDPKKYTYDEVLNHQKYSKVVTLYCVTGWDATIFWEGILLKDLFDEVKVKPEANTVIFYAADDYTTSLPLNYILENDIMIADKMNNITLIPERGFPFQLVAEEKLGYKWIKWITKIELSNDHDYRGYWESRGYSNKANI